MVSRLVLEYDGRPFAGWATQPGARTVSGELSRALGTVLQREVSLTVGGRTDRGVHALGQVVSYEGPPPRLRSVNALLPDEISVTAAAAAPAGFSARHSAVSRVYLYRLLARDQPSPFQRGRALWWPHAVDEDLLQGCALALGGEHDFTAFTPTESQHRRFRRRILDASWRRSGDFLEFWVEADSFLRHMNRILLGTMLEVGTGRRRLEDFTALLEGGPRSQAGATAPAHGLYLVAVRYEERGPAAADEAHAAAPLTTILH